mmetsp:Transcript_106178/g.310362  ORF Transcript_106178/g.310362 Transcript_106178/m.310362 type:complete len:419 (+) Transcript_106178:52-1308(+)
MATLLRGNSDMQKPLLRRDSLGHESVDESQPQLRGGERIRNRRSVRFVTKETCVRFDTKETCIPPQPPQTSFRQKVWAFFDSDTEEEHRSVWAQRYDVLTAGLIVVNVIADVLDSIDDFPFRENDSLVFRILERMTCLLFTVEYMLRLWSCVESAEFVKRASSPVMDRLRFATRALPVLDFVVLSVFYADIFLTTDLVRGFQSLRIIRVLRLLLLLKMERQTQAFNLIVQVLSKKKGELKATLFMAAVLLVMASTAMYYVENESQPEEFSSIPATMWWSVTAMTTVGYGDIYPITTPGKILGSCVAFIGVGLFALPSGIISSGFIEVLDEVRQADAEEIAEMVAEDTEHVNELRADLGSLRTLVEDMQRNMQSQQDAILKLLQPQAASGAAPALPCSGCAGGEVTPGSPRRQLPGMAS